MSIVTFPVEPGAHYLITRRANLQTMESGYWIEPATDGNGKAPNTPGEWFGFEETLSLVPTDPNKKTPPATIRIDESVETQPREDEKWREENQIPPAPLVDNQADAKLEGKFRTPEAGNAQINAQAVEKGGDPFANPAPDNADPFATGKDELAADARAKKPLTTLPENVKAAVAAMPEIPWVLLNTAVGWANNNQLFDNQVAAAANAYVLWQQSGGGMAPTAPLSDGTQASAAVENADPFTAGHYPVTEAGADPFAAISGLTANANARPDNTKIRST